MFASVQGMLKKAASGVLAILPCSRTMSTLRASKGLRPCWTDFFEHPPPLTIRDSSGAFIGHWSEIFNRPVQRVTRVVCSLVLIPFMVALGGTALTQANTIEGFGKLKLGMTPREVEALQGCSSNTECLYDLLGKNRYFALTYGANESNSTTKSPPSPTAELTKIDIDMGNHTRELFGELYETLVSQYPVSHVPTESEDTRFQEGTDNELIIGFADGSVILKIVRRPFGNLILRVVYQDGAAAEALREYWERTRPQ